MYFDRDGTLIRARVVDGRPYSIREADDLELEDGALEACRALRAAGFLLVVVTNQPEIARGTQTWANVDAVHKRLRDALPIDEIVVCPHDDGDRCACRKPLPGMLVDAATRLEIDLGTSYLVGDRWRDVEAGVWAGCTTVFLDRQYSEAVPHQPDKTVRELGEATAWILARNKS